MLKMRKKKSEALAEHIRKKLQEHPFPAGTPVASSREIARKYKVSLSTADQALHQLVEEEFLYRVRGSGTFLKQDSQARILHIGIADQIVSALYLPPEINRILNRHFEIAEKKLGEHHCLAELISYPAMMQGYPLNSLSGLLVSINYLDPAARRLLQEKQIPVVVYRHSVMDPEFSCAFYDYGTGMKEALDYMKIRKNDRFVAVCETTSTGRHALEEWKTQLALHGVAEDRITAYDITVMEREISCYRLVRVNSAKFRDAVILTSNDEIAVNLINALTLENYTCGRDYRLIGIGDHESYGMAVGKDGPIIASVRTPIETMAEEAVKLLLYKINRSVDYNCQIRITTSFVPRLSAGCI